MSWSGAKIVAIALLIQTSMGPSSASILAAASSSASASATSVGIASARPPDFSTSSAAASSRSRPRAIRPTAAPRCAKARPTPADAPVTTTTSGTQRLSPANAAENDLARPRLPRPSVGPGPTDCPKQTIVTAGSQRNSTLRAGDRLPWARLGAWPQRVPEKDASSPGSTMAEVVGAGQQGDDLGVARHLAGELGERLEPLDDEVAVPARPLEDAAGDEERLAADERTEALVDRRRDDQVDLPVLVLEGHEDDAVRRGRPLARDREARERDAGAIRLLEELGAREDVARQVRAEQLERMRADGDARRPVVGEHPLPGRLLGQLGDLRRRLQRQGELALLASRARHAQRARDEPEP